jgi:hypothetical protein
LDSADNASFLERSVSAAELRTDPLLAEPDGLLGLTGGEVGAGLESPSGIYVRGGAPDQTGYLLDGIPVFSPYHSAGLFSAWNPDALERLDLTSGLPASGSSHALSGVVEATTRSPGSLARVQGGMSTSNARVAMDGPIGRTGAGYLVSLRTGYPGLIAPRNEASYLGGNTRDLLAKVESPLLRGALRLLFYDNSNAIGSNVPPDGADGGLLRNGFHWRSRSIGAQWDERRGNTLVHLQSWMASTGAGATWIGTAPLDMVAERKDVGLLGMLERSGTRSTTRSGLRIERSWTAYQVARRDGSVSPYDLNARTLMGSVYLQHERVFDPKAAAQIGVSVTSAAVGTYLDLQARFRRRLSRTMFLSAGYGLSHQFAQSLRNPESVVGNIFPPDLYVGAGAGVPVARNERAVISADYRPTPAVHLGAQAYLSSSSGLLLVAPTTDDPFATSGFTTGSGTVPGFSLDATLSGSRYGLVARYGWQQVRLEHTHSTYTPLQGTSQEFELGAILFPSATASIRLAATGAFGRRATAVSGPFEWEGCNLLDRGCEFTGSPQTIGAIGATRLPAYVRLDLSLRKHWHLSIGHRDVTLGAFGTITNLLGRKNVMTVLTEPATGRTSSIEMRPRAPLVAGVDWLF